MYKHNLQGVDAGLFSVRRKLCEAWEFKQIDEGSLEDKVYN